MIDLSPLLASNITRGICARSTRLWSEMILPGIVNFFFKLNTEGCRPGTFEYSGHPIVSKTLGFYMDDPVTLRAAEENMVWVANSNIEATKQKGEFLFRLGEDDGVNPTAEGDL